MTNNTNKKNKELTEAQESSSEGQSETAAIPSFENLKNLTETSPAIQKILGGLDLRGLDRRSALEEMNNVIVKELEEELKKNPESEVAKDLNEFKAKVTELLREDFEKRLALEADKLDVPVEDFVADYAREEYALRAKQKKPSTKVFETGEGSDVLEESIKQTILSRVIGGRDALTGINNRVSFDQQVEKRRKEAKDRGEFSMIMIDIDKFKKVNDTYGHQAGDYVLKKVADALKKNMRKGDMLARYGGEEIVVIAPNANGDASGFAERLRRTVKNEKIVFEGQEIKVTISAGVAPFDEDFEKMKRMSDEGLYLAKGEKLKTSAGAKVEEGHDEEPTRDQVWYFDKQDGTYKKVMKKNKD